MNHKIMLDTLLKYGDIWIMGAGGKTTLMYFLAKALVGRNESVICTTTTKIFPPTPKQCPDFRCGDASELTFLLKKHPSEFVTLAKAILGGKCIGFSPEEAIGFTNLANHVIVEADGSAGRGIKGHRAFEPVVSVGASCVVAVVGGFCVGKPISPEFVHRPDIFAKLTSARLNDIIEPEHVAEAVVGTDGWLRDIGAKSDIYLVISEPSEKLIKAVANHPKAARLTAVFAFDRTDMTI